ncbi:uncharacterized protein LOC142589858 isoform X2 [Dermacentor variabilis]|uniref:uncharacterized protein LOC142589858 isoform X2 n=1 Tax=Dermacentor variabilis TaxID=34621 RepID=UPI003F5C392A
MSHHARRGCRPELYVVNLVRGLLWHPRPPLTQTAGVVRRTIRRQRALMYARCLLWHLRPSHSRTSNVVRRPVCRQLALMYARGLLWHPRPSHSRTSNVVRRPVCRQLALMYAHTWSIGINPCHTGKLGDCPAQHAIDLVRGLLWYPRPSHSRTSNVVRRPVCRQLALMYAHTWSIGINPCHTGKLGDCPAQHAVDLVRGLLWHPRPPLTQTAGVVRRTVRRQLALMYAHTWSIGINPCHIGNLGDCLAQQAVDLVRGLLWRPRLPLTLTAGIVRRTVRRQRALMYARGLLWHPPPSLGRTVDVVRRPVCLQPALMYAHTWGIGIISCHNGRLGDCRAQHAEDLVEFCAVSDVVTLRNDREERQLVVWFSFQELRAEPFHVLCGAASLPCPAQPPAPRRSKRERRPPNRLTYK